MSLHSASKEGPANAPQGWNSPTQPGTNVLARQFTPSPHVQTVYITTPGLGLRTSAASPQTASRIRACTLSTSHAVGRSPQRTDDGGYSQSQSPNKSPSTPVKPSTTPTACPQITISNKTISMTIPQEMSCNSQNSSNTLNAQPPSQYPSMTTLVASHSVDCQPNLDHDVVLVGSSQQNVFRLPGALFTKNPIASAQIQNNSQNLTNPTKNPDSSGNKQFPISTVKVIGNQELIKNTVYLLKSPNSTTNAVMAKWDGEGFIPYETDQVNMDLTPEQQSKVEQHAPNMLKSGLAGGGGGLTRKVRPNRPLKGNATGLNMSSGPPDNTPAFTMATSSGILKSTETKPQDQSVTSQNLLPNGRLWRHTENPLTRRPLHPDDDTKCSDDPDKSIEIVEEVGGPRTVQAANNAPLHPNDRIKNTNTNDTEMSENSSLNTDVKDQLRDRSLAVCSYCGFTGLNSERCERCRRYLSEGIKNNTNKRLRTDDMGDFASNSSLDSRSFYGKKLNEHSNILEGYPRIIVMNSNNPVGSIISQGNISAIEASKVAKPRRSAPRVRKRKPIIVTEPVTISSDEEEPDSLNSLDTEGQISNVPNIPNIPSVVSEVSQDSNPSSPYCERVKCNCTEEPGDIFPQVPSPRFMKGSLTRKKEMELEGGNKCPEPEKISSHIPEFVNDIINEEDRISCEARSFRVGSFRGEPHGFLTVSMKGIHCKVQAWSGELCDIALKRTEIERVIYCLTAKLSVFFIQTSVQCGIRLREFLLMKEKSEIFFDPCGEKCIHQYVVVILDGKAFLEPVKTGLLKLFTKYKAEHNTLRSDFLKHVTFNDANTLLVNCTANIDSLQNKIVKGAAGTVSPSAPSTPLTHHDCNRDSPSPPKIGFAGPIEKLITFPPPPKPGGIAVTNEDLYCLNEGEFLNDVIIDFYLKYFYLERLTDEERQRTHIFSSFFYKRLTQRERKSLICEDNEEEEDTTPIEKRHARVRTWTRHVDLFKKDFIIVPINEHSHWFLAIICFPGKLKEEHVMYFPRRKLISVKCDNSDQTMEASEEDSSSVTTKDLPESESQQSDNTVGSPVKTELSDNLTTSASPSVSPVPISSTSQSTVNSASEVSQIVNAGDSSSAQSQISQASDRPEEPMETDNQQHEGTLKTDNSDTCDNDSELENISYLPSLNIPSQNTQLEQPQKNEPAENSSGIDSVTNDTNQDSTNVTGEVKNENSIQQNSSQNPPKAPFIREGKEVIGRELTAEEIESGESKKDWMGGTRRPCILVFDSLVGPSRSSVVRILREYLQVEWKLKQKTDRSFDRETIKGGNPKVPQQDNYSDCGIYVLQYVESFFKDPIMDYSIPMRIPNWFDLNTVNRKRQDIMELIRNLQVTQQNQRHLRHTQLKQTTR